jgi:uncharacterized membrane protein
MSVGLITFWVVLIATMVLLVRWLGCSEKRSDERSTTPSAEHVLGDRSAPGEIDESGDRRRRPDG